MTVLLGDNQGFDGVGGNDTLIGGNGTDNLVGGGGDDSLRGSNGQDTLVGGFGNDTLRGSSGADVFAIASGEGQDNIVDFSLGEDRIGLSGGLQFDDLTFNGNAIQLGNETLVTLDNVDVTSLTEINFTTV